MQANLVITDMRDGAFIPSTVAPGVVQMSPLAARGVFSVRLFFFPQPWPSSCKAGGRGHENIVFPRRRAYSEKQVTRDLRARREEVV